VRGLEFDPEILGTAALVALVKPAMRMAAFPLLLLARLSWLRLPEWVSDECSASSFGQGNDAPSPSTTEETAL
jgi:hypothetical protein